MRLSHPAWLEIDLAALAHNAGVLRRAIPPGTRLGILVKANAYGHGLEMSARAAIAGGADQLIVAALDEALALRSAGLAAPILVVYPIPAEGLGEAVGAGLELSVSGMASLRPLLAAWAVGRDRQPAAELRLHVEVDSGMGRGGVPPDGLVELVELIEQAPRTSLAGVWSHLADGASAADTCRQAQRFEGALAALAAGGRTVPPRHIAATEGIFAGGAPAYELVRVGLGFYGELGLGVRPAAEFAALAAELRPAMTVKARPVRLELLPAGSSVGYGSEWTAGRPSLVASLPLGYADGWARSYWPGAEALVRGRRVPLIGRVSMDSVCADLTELGSAGEIDLDDEFVLLGEQGGERIAAGDLAALRGTIVNEVLCAFGPRLPRIYLDADGQPVALSRGMERVEKLAGGSQ